MLTRTLPKKLTELGRLRIGDREANRKGGGTHPHKLDKFRLTSSNKPLLEYAAKHPDIGGDVREWVDAPGDGKQWELYTTTDTLEVVIPTFSAVNLSYELWSNAGCERRCTGEFLTHCSRDEGMVGSACACPENDEERQRLASDGKACARILRLNVILPDLPGAGFWRLDTKGFYATAELLGTLELLKQAGAENMMIEASLRLEQRQTKKPGKGDGKGTLNYVVPVLWPRYTFRQIAAANEARQHVLMAETRKPLAAHIDDLYGTDNAAHSISDAMVSVGSPRIRQQQGPSLPIEGQITEFILANGGTEDSVVAWWARQRAKHADLSPGYMAYLFEKLQAEVARRARNAAADHAPAINPVATEESEETPEEADGATTMLVTSSDEDDEWALWNEEAREITDSQR